MVPKDQTKTQKRAWLWEFSKRIVTTVTIMFVVAYIFCCILLVFYPDSSSIQFIIENISDVFKVTVVSYAVKAGFENVCKIRRSDHELYSEQFWGNYNSSCDNSRSN